MTSKEIKEKTKNRVAAFPAIARSRKDNAIVLFSSYKRGTFLTKGTEKNSTEIGNNLEELYSIENEDQWEILNDVTINFKS